MTRWCVAVAIFLPISKFHGFFTPLATMRAPLLFALASMALLGMAMSTWKPGDLMKAWIWRCAFGIVFLAVAGIPLGIYPGNSFAYFKDALITTILLAIMVWAVARTRNGLRFMVRTVTMACIVAGTLALVTGRRDDAGRLSGAFAYDPNDLALVCAIGLPLAIWWLADRTSKVRWLMLPSAAVLLYTAVGTSSRGGFLALCAVVAGFIFFGARSHSKGVKKLSIILALGAVVSFPLLPADYRATLSTIVDDSDYNRTSPRGRKEVWKRGIGYAADRPLFGVGLSNFNTAEGWLSDLARDRMPGQGHKWSTAHNSVVQITAELGFGGGLLFVTIVIGSIIALAKKRTQKLYDDPLPMFLGIAMMAFLVGGFFLSFAYYELTWTLWALNAALLLQVRRIARHRALERAGRLRTTPAA